MRWILGDGKILFWDDIWLGDKPLRERCLDTRGRPMARVADFWREDQWDRGKIRTAQRQAGIPQHVIDDIFNVPILTGHPDIPRWILNRKGDFTVASAWEANRARRRVIPALSDIWNEGLTGSMSIFMWRLISNRIPVDAKLQWRNISIASKCHCCNERPECETLQHLFVAGQGASRVWRFFDSWFEGHTEPILATDSVPTRLEKWATRTRQTSKAHIARVLPCVIFWFLWAERNNCRHNGARFREFSVIWQVQLHIQRGMESGRLKAKHFVGVKSATACTIPPRNRPPLQKVMVIKWQPPDPPGIKLNTKGIFSPSAYRGGCGGVLRDHRGRMVSAFLAPATVLSDLEAEMEAILQGLIRARECNVPIWIETNSHQAVALIKSGAWGPASIRQILTKIRLIQRECRCQASFVHQDGNKAAELLAHLGCDAPMAQDFEEESAPRLLRATILLERIGTPYVRICDDD